MVKSVKLKHKQETRAKKSESQKTESKNSPSFLP